jgi:hypothetical protein
MSPVTLLGWIIFFGKEHEYWADTINPKPIDF